MRHAITMGKLNKLNLTNFRTESTALCPKCQKLVGLTSLSKTTDFYKTEVERIYLLIYRGKLHPIHNRRGEVMICNDSLFTFFEQRETQILNLNRLSTQIC